MEFKIKANGGRKTLKEECAIFNASMAQAVRVLGESEYLILKTTIEDIVNREGRGACVDFLRKQAKFEFSKELVNKIYLEVVAPKKPSEVVEKEAVMEYMKRHRWLYTDLINKKYIG